MSHRARPRGLLLLMLLSAMWFAVRLASTKSSGPGDPIRFSAPPVFVGVAPPQSVLYQATTDSVAGLTLNVPEHVLESETRRIMEGRTDDRQLEQELVALLPPHLSGKTIVELG